MTFCHTCNTRVEDAIAALCTRPHCDGRKQVEKEQRQAQQKRWADERNEQGYDHD